MNSTIWAIPGFLGLASDWNFLDLKNLKSVDITAFDLNSLQGWAKQFNDYAYSPKKKAILMGYSLGGRLALHALLCHPQQWKGAIIISAHPGLTDRIEKEKRLQSDQQWAERFLNEEWDCLMQHWNSQAVFAQEPFHPQRHEHQYERKTLAKILTQLSLGRQTNLRQQIKKLPIPILWITGCDDHRFNEIAMGVRFMHPISRWEKITQSGHRVPWIQSSIFLDRVNHFLRMLHQFEFLNEKE